MTVTADEPSPPRPPQTRSEGARLIGGMIVVCAGLAVVAAVAVIAMLLVKKTTSDVVAIATASSFSVVGTVVGAYFGVKIGSDNTQAAVAGMKDEAAKAQAFAAHVNPADAEKAIAHAKSLVGDLPIVGRR